MSSRRSLMVLIVVLAVVDAACGSSGTSHPTAGTAKPPSKTVTLMTHDSFAASKSVLAEFTRETGYTVKVLKSGDAGAAVGKAIIVRSRPVADAFFGVDNTFLTRALDAGLFEPFAATGLARVPARFLDREHRVTPIDTGAVCVNDDLAWFGHDGHPAAPASLSDLTKPAYRKLLVVENPATSSPGLAFLLASIAAFGEKGWPDYWRALRANGVRVVDGWEQAYFTDFTAGGSSDGDRPLVVSYSTDPASDVVFSDGKKTTPAVGVVPGTCFAQVEFAGVLANAKNPEGARALINFMLTRRFQQDVPLQMYVYPVVAGTPLPTVFQKFAVPPKHPYTMLPSAIGKKRKDWTDEWTQIVLH